MKSTQVGNGMLSCAHLECAEEQTSSQVLTVAMASSDVLSRLGSESSGITSHTEGSPWNIHNELDIFINYRSILNISYTYLEGYKTSDPKTCNADLR